MPSISLQDVDPGSTITNDDVNANNATLEDAINGPNAAAPGTGLGDTNFAANSPVVIASGGIAGLGTVRAGKAGMLRMATTPYDFIALVYDATLGKWVSDVVLSLEQQEQFTDTGTSYSIASAEKFPQVVIPNFKAYYDAGLRPQFFLASFLQNSGANNTFFLPGLFAFDSGDTSRVSLNVTAPELSLAGATQKFTRVNWTVATLSAPTKQHAYLVVRTKVSAGTGTYENSSIRMRWVSA